MTTLAKLTSLLGEPPAKVALNSAVIEHVDCDGYEEVKVEYNVESGERISAFLLLPQELDSEPNSTASKEAKNKTPAIFCHHQHASDFALGKSEVVGHKGDPDQALGPELARLGYIVLATDAIGFEDRNWTQGTGRAEYLEMAYRIVKGQTLLSKVLHDISVGIDYLESLDRVNPARIGFIGHSYGGRMALWAPSVDKRIKASVSHCGCVNFKDSVEQDAGIQPEFCVPNILSFGDIEDVVKLISPRALYISGTSEDKYSYGAESMYRYAKDAFPESQFQYKVWNADHEFSKEMREAAYQFLENKL